MNTVSKRTFNLVLAGVMIAMGTALGFVKPFELPYGGAITLCSMLRIPVCMHNVPEEEIYRPSAWNAFGTKDREGADYRACKNFGPLYK